MDRLSVSSMRLLTRYQGRTDFAYKASSLHRFHFGGLTNAGSYDIPQYEMEHATRQTGREEKRLSKLIAGYLQDSGQMEPSEKK